MALRPTHYLRPDPKYSGAYALENDGRPPAYYELKSDPKFWKGPMSEEELLYRFQYAHFVNADIFNPVILSTSSDGQRLLQGLARYIEKGTPDAELNRWIKLFHNDSPKNFLDATGHADTDFNLNWIRNLAHVRGYPEFDLLEIRRRFNRLITIVSDRSLPLPSRPKCILDSLKAKFLSHGNLPGRNYDSSLGK
jgi:hypothetical protein